MKTIDLLNALDGNTYVTLTNRSMIECKGVCNVILHLYTDQDQAFVDTILQRDVKTVSCLDKDHILIIQ